MQKYLPNILTLSRIVVIPVFVLFFYIEGHFSQQVAAWLFAAASITDFIDGWLARKWKVQSKLGRFLDPIADKLLVATAIIMLVKIDRADVIPAILILCREILVSGLREFLAELNVSVPVSRLAKVKTGVQMVALFSLILTSDLGDKDIYVLLGRAALWIASVLTIITGYAYLKAGLKHMADKD